MNLRVRLARLEQQVAGLPQAPPHLTATEAAERLGLALTEGETALLRSGEGAHPCSLVTFLREMADLAAVPVPHWYPTEADFADLDRQIHAMGREFAEGWQGGPVSCPEEAFLIAVSRGVRPPEVTL